MKPLKSDLNYTQTLIRNLISDNKSLHEDVEDFRVVLEAVADKLKDLKKELDNEKIRGQKVDFLEEQISQERKKGDSLAESNFRLKERYLSMLEVMRQAAFEISEQDKEDQLVIDHLIRENKHLREMLGISRLDESAMKEIDEALLMEEEGLVSMNQQEYQTIIAEFVKKKQKKEENLLLPPKPTKKSYLLAPKQESNPQ
ncbi:unnamed protein product [Blepharisma stoltei]|uniref:Uncharacterized protein n=1 Tax=Blepharisma stoltei TaxID=1481888 RepID=A0AAU9JCU4_9CILI|nr:unnamed protein product [Blepharisma stoltei]